MVLQYCNLDGDYGICCVWSHFFRFSLDFIINIKKYLNKKMKPNIGLMTYIPNALFYFIFGAWMASIIVVLLTIIMSNF